MNNLDVNEDRVETLYGTRFNGVFTISGIVHVIRSVSELPYFREGEILVAEKIDPAWTDQLALAKAIIEEAGDHNSVAAELASQYDIAATVNVPGAMLNLRSGDIVTMYASGEVERINEQRAPDSPMRVSVPAAVAARSASGIITAPNVVAFSSHDKNASSEELADDSESPDDHDDPAGCDGVGH